MTLIIYHNNKPDVACPDGAAAAWCALKARPEARTQGCCYGDPMPEIEDGEEVIIVDFSFPAVMLEELAERGCKVTVIDHHKTAWEFLQNLTSRITAKYDLTECGTSLTWKHFFPDTPAPAFIDYVKDRDLWNFKEPYSKEIHAAIYYFGFTFDFLNVIQHLSKEQLAESFLKLGTKLMEEKNAVIKAAAERAEPIRVNSEYVVYGVYLQTDAEEQCYSDICTYVYKHLRPDQPFTCCVSRSGGMSLRSDKEGSNFDVAELAKSLGGGGHRNASGISYSYLPV